MCLELTLGPERRLDPRPVRGNKTCVCGFGRLRCILGLTAKHFTRGRFKGVVALRGTDRILLTATGNLYNVNN